MRTPSFAGQVGVTAAESTPHWDLPPVAAGPNILLVILDDTGWSDFGCFGSEIKTPHIDSVAASGLRYSNFHVTPLCSPTRACLMTGRNHHAVGMRFLADTDSGYPNSRGRVKADVPMLPSKLRAKGYGTYLAGKWHLTPRHEITPAGPFGDWPLARGFDKFYGFLGGVTDHYAPELIQDNQQVRPPLCDDYHLSVDLVDQGLKFLHDHHTYTPERPFFLQLAFGATHAPFQAPRQFIEPYVDIFAKGWDVTRADRLARQKALGLLPADTELTERNLGVRAWTELRPDEKLLYTHLQAAYAGFLEHADTQLGRLLAGLEKMGLRDDTLVIVMSDNGASREGGTHGAVDINGPYSGHPQSVQEQLKSLHLIGGPKGPAHYPEGWAMAGNTPFRRYKQLVDLGGVRSPLIVAWPKHIKARGEVRTQFVHAIDVAPTLMDLAQQDELSAADWADGSSFAPTFDDAAVPAVRMTQYWEMMGHRAIWHDGWKAVTEHTPGTPYEQDEWRLYATQIDFSEMHNLALSQPQKLEQLKALWWDAAHKYDVFPLDDRTLVQLIGLHTPLSGHNRQRLTLRPGQSMVPSATGLTSSARSLQARVLFRERTAEHEGVLIASGSEGGGYSFYIQEGRLHFEHVCLGTRTLCTSDVTVPTHSESVGFRLLKGEGRSAFLELLHEDTLVGRQHIAHTSRHLSFLGLFTCGDPISQISQRYEGVFEFDHAVVETIEFEFLDVESPEVRAALTLATE